MALLLLNDTAAKTWSDARDTPLGPRGYQLGYQGCL
jgi:hypothetical protein